jgi:hypothetical protein
MVIVPEAVEPQQDILLRGLNTPAGGDLVIMGGVAAFRFQGGPGYRGDDLVFDPPSPRAPGGYIAWG